MHDDALDRLRAENPVPDPLPGPSLEAIRTRLDDDGEPTRRRRRATRVIPIALSVVVVVAIVVAAVTTGARHAPSRRSAPQSTSIAAARQASDTAGARRAAADFLDHMLPTDGADWARGSMAIAYVSRVDIRSETGCLAARELPGPPADPEPSPRFGTVELPNMPAIRAAHNIGVTSVTFPPSPARGLSASRRRAYRAGLAACASRARSVTTFASDPSADAIVESWYDVMDTVARSPEVQAAMRAGARCAGATAFPAANASEEIERVEARLTPLVTSGRAHEVAAVDAAGAAVLVRCFSHAEAIQTRLLAAERRRVITERAAEIGRLEREVRSQVAADEARYGLAFH